MFFRSLSKGWHKITLPNASKFDKDLVLKALANGCSQPFTPVCFVKNGANFSFHVESPSAASALKLLDKKVSLTHNFLIKVKVAPSPAPKHELNSEVKEKIKVAMSNRYNVTEKILNLKNFHNDPMFVGEAAYVPLARSNVMNNVIRVIGEHIPDVVGIDFSENKLPALDHFSLLEDYAPNLNMLNISKNRLNDVRELEKLQHLPLKILHIKDNALERKFPHRPDLVSKIRKALPKLEILDGEQLPANIVFEEEETDSSKLVPAKQKLMSVDERAKPLMLTFLQQYFSAYDQDDRSSLIQAYHAKAMFSMSAVYPPNTTSHGSQKLTEYQVDARNLNLIVQPNKRFSFLKQGHQKVIEFINELPKTTHDLDTFTLDIPVVSDGFLTMTVTGGKKTITCNKTYSHSSTVW